MAQSSKEVSTLPILRSTDFILVSDDEILEICSSQETS